ncbi:MAG: S41 family peptidase [Anaerolineales bacterium]
MKTRFVFLLFVIPLLIASCSAATGASTPQGSSQPLSDQFPAAEIVNDEGGTVTVTGEVAYTNPFFTAGVAEPLVILEDQAGFVDRDRGYLMPLESQTMGQITSDFFTSPFTYSLSLPIVPQGGQRDVDQDGASDEGVFVFAPAYWTNTFGDPFLEERDLGGGGWSGAYASTRLSEEAATEMEYIGGKIIVYAPDSQQGFPSGFGADNKLFTEDDPIVVIPQGYTMVDLDTDPFTFDRSRAVVMDLLEPEGAALDDFSALSYLEAFDEMIAMMRQEYAFTELKGLDWDALNAEFRPRFEAAAEDNDAAAYAFALRDFLWSIPDGHVGFSQPEVVYNQFLTDISTGVGLSIRETDDGRVIVVFLTPGGPAEEAGIQLGAEITTLNGEPIGDAIAATLPWSSPFSSAHSERLQQLRYVVRFPQVMDVEVGYQNPGGAASTATLTTSTEQVSFSQSSFYAGITGTELPVEFQILDNGYGYVAIYSFFDNQVLSVQLWERMINTLNEQAVPGLVIDMRVNGGGFGFLAAQMAAYFFDEELELGTAARWDESLGEFYVDPNRPDVFYPPPADMRYHGKIAVIVSPSCSSACEFFVRDMTLQERATIVGHYPTDGLGGGVKDFNMPDGISVRFPIARPLDMEGNIIIEGVGIVPNVDVPVDEATLLSDGDPLLEAAVRVLSTSTVAGMVPSGPPAVDGDYGVVDQLNSRTPFMEDLVREEYSEDERSSPNTLTYSVVMSESTAAIAGYYWCTSTQDILDENWAKIEVSVELDGQAISVDDMDFESLESAQGPCNLLTVLLSDWPVGEHTLVVTAVFTAALNDGIAEEDYPAGTYRSEFTIYVEN